MNCLICLLYKKLKEERRLKELERKRMKEEDRRLKRERDRKEMLERKQAGDSGKSKDAITVKTLSSSSVVCACCYYKHLTWPLLSSPHLSSPISALPCSDSGFIAYCYCLHLMYVRLDMLPWQP